MRQGGCEVGAAVRPVGGRTAAGPSHPHSRDCVHIVAEAQRIPKSRAGRSRRMNRVLHMNNVTRSIVRQTERGWKKNAAREVSHGRLEEERGRAQDGQIDGPHGSIRVPAALRQIPEEGQRPLPPHEPPRRRISPLSWRQYQHRHHRPPSSEESRRALSGPFFLVLAPTVPRWLGIGEHRRFASHETAASESVRPCGGSNAGRSAQVLRQLAKAAENSPARECRRSSAVAMRGAAGPFLVHGSRRYGARCRLWRRDVAAGPRGQHGSTRVFVSRRAAIFCAEPSRPSTLR